MKEYNWRQERCKIRNQVQVATNVELKHSTPAKGKFSAVILLGAGIVIAGVIFIIYKKSENSQSLVLPVSSSPAASSQQPIEPPRKENPPRDNNSPEVLQIMQEAKKAHQAGDYQTAIRKYKTAADMGNSVAQYAYASYMYLGKYVPRNLTEAEKYFNLSAEQGFCYAMVDYGSLLIHGNVFRKNIKKGEELLYSALDSKILPLQRRFSAAEILLCIEISDIDLSCEEYLRLHRKGRKGVEECAAQKHEDAVKMWNSLKSYPEAELLYRQGSFYEENFPAKKLLWDTAITLGHQEAKLLLAYLFLDGKYTPQDIPKARQYARLYSANANLEENYRLAILFQIYKDYEFSVPLLCKNAEQGHAESQINLYFNFSDGTNGFKKNIPEALRFLKMAVQKKHPGALFLFALCHLMGEVIPEDVERGIYYLKQAAKLGDKNAKEVLEYLGVPTGNISLQKQQLNNYSKKILATPKKIQWVFPEKMTPAPLINIKKITNLHFDFEQLPDLHEQQDEFVFKMTK